MKISITYPVEGVTAIRIDNVLTDVLSQIGGFDYALSYLVDETVLIDTGFSWARKAMRKALMDLGRACLDFCVRGGLVVDSGGT